MLQLPRLLITFLILTTLTHAQTPTNQEICEASQSQFGKSKSNIEGKVISVADGDTITVLDKNYKQYKIRLNGIDAPEASQDFGNKAKQFLTNAINLGI